jgi:hypothetical protein
MRTTLVILLWSALASGQELERPFVSNDCKNLKFVEDHFEDFILYQYLMSGRMKLELVGVPLAGMTWAMATQRLAKINSELPALLQENMQLSIEIREFDALRASANADVSRMGELQASIERKSARILEANSRISQYKMELGAIENMAKANDLKPDGLRKAAKAMRLSETKFDIFGEIAKAKGTVQTAEEGIKRVQGKLEVLDNRMLENINRRVQIADDWKAGPVGESAPKARNLRVAADNLRRSTTVELSAARSAERWATAGRWASRGSLAVMAADLAATGYLAMVDTGVIDPPRWMAEQTYKNNPSLLADKRSGYTFAERCNYLRSNKETADYFAQISLAITDLIDKKNSGLYVAKSEMKEPTMLIVDPRSFMRASSGNR